MFIRFNCYYNHYNSIYKLKKKYSIVEINALWVKMTSSYSTKECMYSELELVFKRRFNELVRAPSNTLFAVFYGLEK